MALMDWFKKKPIEQPAYPMTKLDDYIQKFIPVSVQAFYRYVTHARMAGNHPPGYQLGNDDRYVAFCFGFIDAPSQKMGFSGSDILNVILPRYIRALQSEGLLPGGSVEAQALRHRIGQIANNPDYWSAIGMGGEQALVTFGMAEVGRDRFALCRVLDLPTPKL